MSDWIESRTNLARHRKTRRFAELLNIPRPLAVGHLTCWWHRVMEESPEGDLSVWSPADIADAALFEGDPELFRTALVEAGFLDVIDGVQRPHDWDDYAGRLIDRRARNAERMRGARAAARSQDGPPHDERVAVHSTSGARATHVDADDDARAKLPDQPDRTGPTGPDQPDRPATAARAQAEALVDEFYETLGIEPHGLTRSVRRREVSIAGQLVDAGAPPGEARRFVEWCRAAPFRPVPSDLRVYEQKRAQFLAALEPVAAGPPGRRNGVSPLERAELSGVGELV